ncbi:uncharacterized protein LOC122401884 [Colletes gigas]|uniref:uncharacterized protein LOC122401884 n=1 Tax=Colletes gigas TaxID=935657 RepID=UPI001C9AAF38|nr:uncharacterized protein LOC122401884 [Colletes gigas]
MNLPRFSSVRDKPNYYAKPEGTDPFQKLRAVTAITFKSSVLFALYDAYLVCRAPTMHQAAINAARIILPINFGALYLTSAIYISTRIRETDDLGNYAIGAIATGPVIHRILKCPFFNTVQLTILLAFCAVSYKGLQEDGQSGYSLGNRWAGSTMQHYE